MTVSTYLVGVWLHRRNISVSYVSSNVYGALEGVVNTSQLSRIPTDIVEPA